MKKGLVFIFFISIFSFELFAQKIPAKIPPKKVFEEFLVKEGAEPVIFFKRLLKKFPLILIGSDVYVKEQVDFFVELLPVIHRSKYDYILLDIGTTDKQEYVDKFLNASIRDVSILKPVFENMADLSGWGYKEYYRIFETIYDLNHSTSSAEKQLSIMLMDKPIQIEQMKKDKNGYMEYLKAKSQYNANLISGKIFAPKKTAVYFGNKLNTFTSFGQTFANLLVNQSRPLIFSILLNTLDRNEEQKKSKPICHGYIEQIFKNYKKLPIAFNLKSKSPFGALKSCFVEEPAFSAMKGIDWPLSDGWDGFIYLKNPKDFNCITVDEKFYKEEGLLKAIKERNDFYCRNFK